MHQNFWRVVLSRKTAKALPKLPSVLLSGARHREGLTQVELAERSGILRRLISEMKNNKRPIGRMNVRKLAEVLHIDLRRLLSV